jgi:transposase
MSYKIGVDKAQTAILPMCPDDFVPENHICRVICAFTERLDMGALGYKYAETKSTGCRPYDPRMMLNLYIYGYLHRVRSSRRLHAETTRNVEVMWLLDGLSPDDKTICNFRKDNAKALRETFRAFSKMCAALGLFGGETVAADGTKICANNSRKNNHNKTTVERETSRLDKKISEYLNALDEADQAEAAQSPPNADEIRAALEKLCAREVEFGEFLTRLEIEGEISTIDPDARLMRSGGSKKEKGFSHEDFLYDQETDAYTCPCQNQLRFMRTQTHSADKEYRLYENFAACHKCPRKADCTKGRWRALWRLPYQNALDDVDERTRNGKALYRKRREIAEHPFGTIKAVWGFRQFLCRTKPKAGAETAPAFLAYNLRRAANVFNENGGSLAAALRG